MTKPQFNITDLKGQNSNSLFDNDRIIPLIKESGQNYLNQLVKYLSESANCKYAFVGLVAENETHVETKSFYANGSLAKDFIYNLKNTPCENVIKEKACLIKDSVQELYPKDKDLKDLGVESYIGVPLFDIERKPVGIVVLMDDEPFSDMVRTLSLIDILESKTELEIERLKLKERLVLSRQGYKDVFDNFQDVFFIVYYNDKNEQIDLVMSPSAKKNLGYDLKELKALDFSSLFVRELEREIFYHHIKTEREIKGELHLMENKSGEKLYVEVDCKYIDDNLLPGAKYGIRGVLKDVTKKHKEKLRTEIAFLIAQKSERRLTSVKSLVEFIRQSLMNVVNVSNFYIAIHEKEKNNLFFPIVFDDDSGMLSDSEVRMPFQNSFTELIIRSKKSIIKNKEGLTRVIKTEELNPRGKLPEFYVGVPLKSEGKCFGAMVMQTYDKGDYYSKEDVDLFHFIGTQVAYIIERTLWQEELIKKEEHYRSLIENSSEIFGVVNRFGVVQYMSESTLKITGYSPLSFIGKNIKEIMSEGLIFKGLEGVRGNLKNYTEVINFKNKNGIELFLEITLNVRNHQYVFNAKDITKRVLAEQERNVSFKQIEDLKHALNYTAAIFFTNRETYKITDINKNIEKISGYKRDELIGESPTIFNSSKSSSLAKEVISSKVDSGEVWQGEMNYQRKDGTLYWVYETIALVVGAEGEPDQFISIQYDITEAKKIKRDLVREVIEAQEQERERFAMEIHDGLGQVLLAAKMNLNALADASDGLENESKEILNTSIELLNNAVQEARGISHGLMSRVLNRFGLAHAVDEIVGNIGRSSGLDFNFKHNIVKERFSDEIEMGLYRTLQELIQNVLKHSKATKADLIILKEGNDLLIKISDNGIGIAKTTILNPESGGIGLRNMRSRIEYLGGEFKIANQVKKGTLITIQITL